MKKLKKIHKPYAVWDYELEIEELNRESLNGWQLVQGGAFHREYERDDSLIYRHQLDYNKKDDVTYYEMFKEQGWEYINSTFNGWNYFRKPFDEKAEESEYLIYTDIDSKKKMIARFINFMFFIFAAAMIANFQHLFNFIETPKIANSGVLIFYAVYIFTLIKAQVGRVSILKGRIPKRRSKVELYILVMILALFFMITGMDRSYKTQGMYETQEANIKEEHTLFYEVDFMDFYYFDIDIAQGTKNPLVLRILNEDGEIVSENQLIEKNEKKKRIFLHRGTYQCIITSMGEAQYSVQIE